MSNAFDIKYYDHMGWEIKYTVQWNSEKHRKTEVFNPKLLVNSAPHGKISKNYRSQSL